MVYSNLVKVLVVEDEHLIASSIKKGLEQENYTVDIAFDGEKGLDLASSGDYDIILLDLLLPKIDGVTVCRELRTEGIHTPILMLTARGEMRDKVQGLDSGADDYLTKPFAFEELLARIRALKRRPEVVTGEVLKAADLSLNSQTFEVRRAGRLIPLSNREYSLLEYLLRHAGRVVTKDQIIDSVWNYDADVLPNTVEVYIRYLRSKIDPPGKKPLIQTIRGFGYRLGEK